MKRSWKRFLIVALIVLSSLFLFAGCTLGTSLNGILEDHNLTARITYYANGGKFEKTKDVKNLYYEAGVIPLNIRDDNAVKNIELKKDGYDLIDWYHAETDDNGELVFEEGSDVPKASDQKADFSQALKAGDCWTLIAEWKIQSRVRVKVAGELSAGEKITVGETQYGYGDEIMVYPYETDNKVNMPSMMKNFTPTNDYTFVQFYADEACTQIQSWPIERGDADVYVYARYLKGEWSILESKKGVSDMFGNGMIMSSEKYLLINDIDCTGTTVNPLSRVAGTFKADEGCEITNLRVTGTVDKQANATVALFGKLTSTARIENVVFENLTVEYTTVYIPDSADYPISFYLTYTEAQSGTTVTGVKLSGTVSIALEGKAWQLITLVKEGDVWTGWQSGEAEAGAEEVVNGFDLTQITVTVTGYPEN